MEKPPYANIKVYTDLIADSEEISAWTSPESFPVYDLNSLQGEQLSNINVLEVIFHGTQGLEIFNQTRFNAFQNFVTEFILTHGLPPYLIKVEHKVSMRNRIRSYKGIVSRLIDRKDFIELELNVGDGYSLIIALLSISELNVSKIFDSFYDNTNCFILLTSTNVFSEDFLKEFYTKHVIVKETTSVNYVSLALDFCKSDTIIARSAGDGGDSEINLQVFCPAIEKEKILHSIRIGN